MSDEPEQFPKRKTEAGLEVRHRAGTGASKAENQPLQVERVIKKGSDLEPKSRRRRSRRHQEAAPPWRIGLLVLTGLVTLGVVVFALWYTNSRSPGAPVEVGPRVERPEAPEVEVSGFVANSTAGEIAAAIETAVREFMNAGSHEERCEWVRGGREMLGKMEAYYAREGNEPPGTFGRIVERSPLAFGGVPAEVVTVEEEGSDEKHVFSVLPGADRMLIDWESAVAYGEVSWQELLEERPVEPVQIRVFVKLDNYYNYEFADEDTWQCLRIKTREADEMLYAYVERDSVVGRRVLEHVRPGLVIPLNVRVKFLPEARERDMIVIDELLHPYWLRDEDLERTLRVE